GLLSQDETRTGPMEGAYARIIGSEREQRQGHACMLALTYSASSDHCEWWLFGVFRGLLRPGLSFRLRSGNPRPPDEWGRDGQGLDGGTGGCWPEVDGCGGRPACCSGRCIELWRPDWPLSPAASPRLPAVGWLRGCAWGMPVQPGSIG